MDCGTNKIWDSGIFCELKIYTWTVGDFNMDCGTYKIWDSGIFCELQIYTFRFIMKR